MKKFLSISICLMMCLTSMLLFGACKAKPKPVSEIEANQVLAAAMTNMESVEAIKMYSNNFMFMGEFCMIATETITYTNFFGVESWVKQEGDYWYDYSISTYEIDNEEVTEYTKALVLSEDGEDEDGDVLSSILSEFENSQFSNASILKEEYSISFKVVEDGVTTTLTFKVQNQTLKAIVVSAGGISMSLAFEFGANVAAEMPEIPSNVEWDEYEPYIKVEGMPTEFVVGETLNLEDVTLDFYEDVESFWADAYDITLDMVSGFSTETAGTRTMTITFYGLTYEIEYTVVEAPVAE